MSAGATGMAAPPTGRVDAEFMRTLGKSSSAPAVVVLDAAANNKPYDTMLCLVEGTMDKFYVLQVIQVEPHGFVCFARWGRTGQIGQSKIFGPFATARPAIQAFAKKFRSKTATSWSEFAAGRFHRVPGKYDVLAAGSVGGFALDSRKAGVTWEYEVMDRVDNKVNGWYGYDDSNATDVEALYVAWRQNPLSSTNLSQRIITSESSGWTYHVDLINHRQRNIKTGKVRAIRRVNPNNYEVPGMASLIVLTGAAAANPTLLAMAAGVPVVGAPPARKSAAGKKKPPPPHVAGPGAALAPSGGATAAAPAPKPSSNAPSSIPLDPFYPAMHASGTPKVHGDLCCLLNQTNLGSVNNNKFNILALVEDGPEFVMFSRWGRVGQTGNVTVHAFSTLDEGVKAFKSTFRRKTGNAWDKRDNFVKHDDRYQLIQVSFADAAKKAAIRSGTDLNAPGSTLHPATQDLLRAVLSKETLDASLKHLNVDLDRLPLGALTQEQVAAGVAVMEALEHQVLKPVPDKAEIIRLTARFYTLIPTAHGWTKPPLVDTPERVREKFDLLTELADIAEALKMEESSAATMAQHELQRPKHPLDTLYESLNASLSLVDPVSNEYKTIAKYASLTSNFLPSSVRNLWAVRRSADEKKRDFHDAVVNRKLLWHGTNAARVGPIIQNSLRVMPHSGGRVGRGVYLASELEKSLGYTWPAKVKGGAQVGVLFLAEVALGKEHHIYVDQSRLTAPPSGFESVVAFGVTEPDAAGDVTIKLDGRDVVVPNARPVKRSQPTSFTHSEYVVYENTRIRLRYVVALDWGSRGMSTWAASRPVQPRFSGAAGTARVMVRWALAAMTRRVR